MVSMIQRMCWNSRGWKVPTGNSSDGGYPSKTGYGHEEWNFQIEDTLEGNVYGYMYYYPSEKTIEKSNGHFKIGFWTVHPDSRIRLLVGIYHDAILATNEELKALYDYYDSNGVFERRAEELVNAVPKIKYPEAIADIKKHYRNHWSPWKCQVEKVELFQQYLPLPEKINDKKVGAYFARPTFVTNSFFDEIQVASSQQNIHIQNSYRKSPLTEDAYYRESSRNLRVIIPRHNKLSNQFCNWLKRKGVSKIAQEKNQVDVYFETQKGTYLAELKICYAVGTTKSIREALGQLLEYNYYPSRVPKNNWIIILDVEPSTKDKEFISLLSNQLSIPLRIGWKSQNGFSFLGGEISF